MISLLVIADDFTGALDTGVQFASSGIATNVLVNLKNSRLGEFEGLQVLVIDAETRHLSREDAYRVVYSIVKNAKDVGVPYLYKKTDSALRGNIGSELEAALEASGETRMIFIPAFPKMNRITKNGIHYIDDLPVSESVFGEDLYEPVQYSSVREIIRSQSSVNIMEVEPDDYAKRGEKGICIYNAQSDEDLIQIANYLKESGEYRLMAGCAGFASLLPSLMNLKGKERKKIKMQNKLLVVSGSTNPITKRQLIYAEKCGVKRFLLEPKQKLEKEYWNTSAGRKKIHELKKYCENRECCILDSNDLNEDKNTIDYAIKLGLSLEQVRTRISEVLGIIIKGLLEEGIKNTLMVTGGDTLLGLMKEIGIQEIEPICELVSGCVLAEFDYQETIHYIVTKSGGFGGERLIEEIMNII